MKSEHLSMDALGGAIARLPDDRLTPARCTFSVAWLPGVLLWTQSARSDTYPIGIPSMPMSRSPGIEPVCRYSSARTLISLPPRDQIL